MLTIQSGFHVQAQSMPYVAEPGDAVIEAGKDNPKSKAYEHPFIQDGKLTNRFDLVLQRNGTQIGRLSPDRQTLMKPMQTTAHDSMRPPRPLPHRFKSSPPPTRPFSSQHRRPLFTASANQTPPPAE